MRHFRVALLLGFGLCATLPLIGQQSGPEMVVVKPKPFDGVLVNPGIGFTTFQRFNGDTLNSGTKWTEGFPIEYQPSRGTLENKDFPETSIAYFRIYWRFIETEQGIYRWDIIDRALETARQRHQTLMLRIAPYGSTPDSDVPAWFARSRTKLSRLIDKGKKAYRAGDQENLAKLERGYEVIRGAYGKPDRIRPYLERGGPEDSRRVAAEIIEIAIEARLSVRTVLDYMRRPGRASVLARKPDEKGGPKTRIRSEEEISKGKHKVVGDPVQCARPETDCRILPLQQPQITPNVDNRQCIKPPTTLKSPIRKAEMPVRMPTLRGCVFAPPPGATQAIQVGT